MASVPHHRKAFGSHRPMSPLQRARNVAQSILVHGLDMASVATWQRYGLERNIEQQVLVRQAVRAEQIAAYIRDRDQGRAS